MRRIAGFGVWRGEEAARVEKAGLATALEVVQGYDMIEKSKMHREVRAGDNRIG